jgi:hypothetical protein
MRYALGELMSEEDLKAELERLRNENASLKRGAATGIRMKVSEKGAVSIYGMGRNDDREKYFGAEAQPNPEPRQGCINDRASQTPPPAPPNHGFGRRFKPASISCRDVRIRSRPPWR